MSCASIREQFSELHDDRLDPVLGRDVQEHLETCKGCRHELALYGKVFRGLSFLREQEVAPAFHMPDELPGAASEPIPTGTPGRVWWTPGAKVAAAVLVLLGLSNILVYELASRDRKPHSAEPRQLVARNAPSESPARTPPAAASVVAADRQGAEYESGAGEVLRLRVARHLDGANLLLRQLHYWPKEAADRAGEALLPVVRYLNASDLEAEVQRNPEALGGMAPRVAAYLQEWDALSEGLETRLSKPLAPGAIPREFQRLVATSRVPYSLRELQPRFFYAGLQGATRDLDRSVRLSQFARGESSPDVLEFLAAESDRFDARYVDAAIAFERLGTEDSDSRLRQLCAYMSAESYLRTQQVDRALAVLSSTKLRVPQNAVILHQDPVGLIYQMAAGPGSIRKTHVGPPSFLQVFPFHRQPGGQSMPHFLEPLMGPAGGGSFRIHFQFHR